MIVCVTASFFALEIITFFALNEHPISCRRPVHLPLSTIRIVERFADGIISNHIINEVFLTGVAKLMRFIWPENERVSRPNLSCTILVTHAPFSRDYQIKLP